MKKTAIKSLFSLLLTVCVLLPTIASPVFSASLEYKIHFVNKENPAGEAIEGAEYTITQTQGAYNPTTGAYESSNIAPFNFIANKSAQQSTSLPHGVRISFQDSVATIVLPEGSYTIKQIKAPVGYYKMLDDIKFHLPATNNTLNGHNNEITITPKVQKILKKAILTKKSNGTLTTLPNVKFKLYRTTDLTSSDPVYSEYTEAYAGQTELTVSSLGKIEVENLPYGKYYFLEHETVAGYNLSKTKVPFEIKEKRVPAVTGPHPAEVLEENVELQNYQKPTANKVLDEKVNASTTDPFISDKGVTVNFTVTVRIPNDIETYKTFEIIDTMDAKLTYQAMTSLEVDNSDVSSLFTIQNVGKDTNNTQEKVKVIVNGAMNTLAPHKGKDLVFKYSAKIDEDTTAGTLMKNKAEVNFKNSEDVIGLIESPTPAIKTVSNTIRVTKVDGSVVTKKLENVEFELWKDTVDTGTKIGTAKATNNQGIVEWSNLTLGTYFIKETKTIGPQGDEPGYRLLDKPTQVILNSTGSETATTEITIKNYKTNVFIPNTGTFGTIGFLIAGLFAFVLVFLLGKKKEVKDEK